MVQTYQSGFRTTLALICNPSDTTMTLATVPTVTAGRLYLTDWLQEEWVSYTGVSGSTVTGLTRWLSQTADPATAGTGKTWIAGTKVKLVAMHDQLADKLQGNQFLGSAQVYATTAARDTALGGDWVATKAYSDVYVTATGLHYQYNLSSNQWEAIETGTVTPNMTTAVAWKWQSSTQVHFDAGTDIWVTWAQNVATNWQIQNMVNTSTAKTALVDADLLLLWDSAAAWINKKITALNAKKYFSKFGWDGSDGAVDGLGNVTITGSNDTYIVKNYSSWAAGSAARVLTITPTNCLLHIKVKWDCDLTNWTFNFEGKGWQGWAQVTGTGQKSGNDGASGSNLIVWLVNTFGGKGNPEAWTAGWWGWGWAGKAANATAGTGTGGSSGWTAWAAALFWWLSTIIAGRRYVMYIGAGWWSGWIGSWAGWSPVWGAGWHWGGAVILEVFGNLTLDNGTTVINMNGTNGANGVAGTNAGAGWGWGGGGWTFLAIYNGTLTGTVTPTVAGGTGGTGANGGSTLWYAWWAGSAWESLITQNTVFS